MENFDLPRIEKTHPTRTAKGFKGKFYIARGNPEDAKTMQYLHSDGVWRPHAVYETKPTGYYGSVEDAEKILRQLP